jgi:ATP phosphoribosyltransferase regulatory subunit
MLRGLYEQYGYRKYRMAKFEEYDFYTEHRDFLPSGRILTFTDVSGRLMALRPDVTMSIVKRTRATLEQPERLYYSESIYRAPREAHEYREIPQIGLEWIGRVTPHVNAELVTLALKSLARIDGDYVLDISHNGFIEGLFESISAPAAAKQALRHCIGTKNAHELSRLVRQRRIDPEQGARLLALIGPLPAGAGGAADPNDMNGMGAGLERLRRLVVNDAMARALDELEQLYDVFRDEREAPSLRLDFSITQDSTYYNGLIFRGYIKSAPRAVLAGGRYDLLLRRMDIRQLEAIGFAVYLDEVARSLRRPAEAGYDAVVLYDETVPPKVLRRAVEAQIAEGRRVYAGPRPPADFPGVGAGGPPPVCYRLTPDGVLLPPLKTPEGAADPDAAAGQPVAGGARP